MKTIQGIPIQEYQAIHYWLKKVYGKANKCEGSNCLGLSQNYQWAKKSGVGYDFKRNNFHMLCRSCHTKQDITEESIKKMAINGKKAIESYEKKREVKNCLMCKKEFIAKLAQRYCVECKPIQYRKKIREWEKKNEKFVKEYHRNYIRKPKNKTI